MAQSSGLPIRVLIRFGINCLLVWSLSSYGSDYFVMTQGPVAVVICGSLLTLMNMIVRPILALITLPLKLFATILAIIVVNGAFVQIIVMIAEQMDPGLLRLTIEGGLMGWVVVACVFGLGNWVMRAIFK